MSKRTLVLLCSIFLIVPLLFIGCSGDDGATGAKGATGDIGPPGADGRDGADGADGADGLGLFAAVNDNLVVNDLVFGVSASDNVTASFSLTDGTNSVTGLPQARMTLYLAGLIPGTNGNSDEWQYWTGVGINSLVETSPGSYLLTSNRLASAAPAGSTKQRGIVRITGVTGYNPINKGYDFALAAPGTPVARGKDVVSDAACKECHGFGVTIHAYGRNDTRTCVICHSPNYSGVDMVADGADMVTMVHQIHTNKADILGAKEFAGHGENWPDLVYPGTILNCAKCHKDVAEADNWKTRPTQTACKSCHTGIKFDGTLSTAIDNVRTFTHFAADNNAFCMACHPPSGATLAIADSHKPASSDDATQRTMTSTIDNVVVDVDGGVTVTFRVFDGGIPVTDSALFADGSLTFNLAKLVPSKNGASSYWQSYLSRIRTKDANKPPVLQGYNEVYTSGTLTNLTGGEYTYKFGLLNADTPGDIRTITHVHNGSATSITGPYSAASLPTMLYEVPYEPALTHRVAMTFRKVAGQIDNKTNAFFDWVPAGTAAETRNIVSRDACSKCHGDSKLHRGYAIELCVGCHNKNSYDPFSGIDTPTLATTDTALPGSSSVILERLVHKVHMGKNLNSGYIINEEDYSKAQYPSGVWSSSSTPNPSNCTVCHDEGNTAMTNKTNWRTKPTSSACGACHDSVEASLHIWQNAQSGDSCVVCHTAGKVAPVEEAHGLK